jgi:hypothetical protein
MELMRKILSLICALALVIASTVAYAALPTITATPAIPQFTINAKSAYTTASTATVLDCTNASAANGSYCNNGAVITQIFFTSTDTSAQSMTCNIVNGATTFLWFTISIAANAGNATNVAPTAAFNAPNINTAPLTGNLYDAYGNPVMLLSNTDKISCTLAAITATKTINIYVVGGAF